MTPKKDDLIDSQNSGFFQDLVLRVKVLWRLMGDRRVNFLLKLLPLFSLIYLISPIDLLPGLTLPVIGALDDAAVVWIGTSLFMNLVPEGIVREHLNALQRVVSGSWRDAPEEPQPDDIIEADARDPDEA
ncbi:MAG: DUF1232 domain-containing protein [Anaerolineales bacterium]|nr:DUF1232 domain-containing protein [Anaerolineales bacterium]